jgi:integrase
MAERSPVHKLTKSKGGWVKRINRRPRWICSDKVAPTGAAADAYYEKNFTDLWQQPVAAEPEPPPGHIKPGDLTVKDLCDRFIVRKEAAGIDPRTIEEYLSAVESLGLTVGESKLVRELLPKDFSAHRAALAARFGPDRLAKYIIMIRGMFKWASLPPIRLPVPEYGDEFKVPSKATFRRARKASREAHGIKLFTAEEIKKLLAAASPHMQAMILLALNGGYGNTDVASLPLSVLDLETGWIDYARGKTGVDRRVSLWPRTIRALRIVIANRPDEILAEWKDMVFVTRHFKRPYITDKRSKNGKLLHKDQISVQFRALCIAAGVRSYGRNFYSLRRTFRNIADECADQRAAALIMGHDVGDTGGIYVHRISDHRLTSIVRFVERSLFSGTSAAGTAAKARRPKPPAAAAASPPPAARPARRAKRP